MRLSLARSEVRYLTPRKPSGTYQSQFGQDFWLLELGLLKEHGFFVEVGCNHPVLNSNTWFLEKYLGWSGISIDGIDFTAAYAAERPRTKFVHSLIDSEAGVRDFYVVKNDVGWEDQMSSMRAEALNLGHGFVAEKTRAKATPLKDVIPVDQHVDVLFVDVEGHELEVIGSIEFGTHKPAVVVAENSGSFYPRRLLVSFLRAKGYRHVARIGTSDDIFRFGGG